MGVESIYRRIRVLAEAALAEHHGVLKTARQHVVAQLMRDRALLQQLIEEVVRAAVENCVGCSHRIRNSSVLQRIHADSAQDVASQDQAAEDHAAELSLFTLMLGVAGVALQDATRTQLLAEASFYRKQVQAMQRKADFFCAVAERLADDQVLVRQVFDEATLVRLFRDTVRV